MKVALIGCPFWGTIYGPNYTLGILAALTKRAGHDPVIFDLNIDFYNAVSDEDKTAYWDYDNHDHKYNKLDILISKHQDTMDRIAQSILDADVDLLAFSVTMFSSYMSIKINEAIKKRNSDLVTVFGGVDCFEKKMASTYLQNGYIDLVCLGEAETCFHDLLNSIDSGTWQKGIKGFLSKANGDVVDCGEPEVCKDLDLNPYPDYSGFNLAKYTEMNKYTTQFSRGCVNHCVFCYEHKIHKKYRYRSASDVAGEITMIMEKTNQDSIFINFADSMINGSVKELEKFCDLLIESDISVSWWGQAAVRKEMSKALLAKMKMAGCSGVSWGIETGSDTILKLMRKNTNIDLIKRVLRDAHDVGILQNTNFIVGFPGETENEFLETCNFIIDNIRYLNIVGTTLLSIQKNAPLYANFQSYNIQDRDAIIDWETTDGLNNLEQRVQKEKIIKSLIGTKYLGSVKTDFDVIDPFLDSLYNRAYGGVMGLLKEAKIKPHDKLLLYGAGEWGKRFKNIFEANGIPVYAFLDSNSFRWGEEFLGCRVVDPDMILETEPDCKVVIASSANRVISEKLRRIGFKEDFNYFGLTSIS
ncbi:MAG: radical SAM protein [Thermodesulfobacteriota bacterium]|nr:radical SAM protein [Thermodesulfobacteriota bacterium]